jgi:hypothetical protein
MLSQSRCILLLWDMSRLVQTCPDLYRLVQTCPDLSRLVQTCQDLSRFFQTCQDLSRLVKTCQDRLSLRDCVEKVSVLLLVLNSGNLYFKKYQSQTRQVSSVETSMLSQSLYLLLLQSRKFNFV